MNYIKAYLVFFLLNFVSYSQTSSSGNEGFKFDLKKNELKNSFQLKTSNLSVHKPYPLKTQINYPALFGMGALYLSAGIGVHIYQRNAWWKDNRTSFHFQNDWPYAMWIDKIGHFYAASLLVHAFSSGLESANFPIEDAMVYGTIAALAFQYYVEIEDGFGAQWGFSPGDAIANTLGACYTLSQYYFPYLQNFQFKFSYFPSEKMRNGIHKGNMIDDYEGQRYWLTFRMKNILPDNLSNVWPEFLNLAVGTSVKELDGKGGGRREIYIGLDFNPLVLPFTGKFGNFVKNTLNYFHLPMPAIRISDKTEFFILIF